MAQKLVKNVIKKRNTSDEKLKKKPTETKEKLKDLDQKEHFTKLRGV